MKQLQRQPPSSEPQQQHFPQPEEGWKVLRWHLAREQQQLAQSWERLQKQHLWRVSSERAISVRLILPVGAAVGSLEDGAAAVSVAVGFGSSVRVPPVAPGVSVLVPEVPDGCFFLLKMALSLSIASSAVIWIFQTSILSMWKSSDMEQLMMMM